MTGNIKLLIIEDSEIDYELIVRQLKNSAHAVHESKVDDRASFVEA
ncbi:MAG: hypothetical protein ABIJ40_18450 [Bacteroidota bacterium]|nr:hypothetical protein [Bacteroidota bacterium]